MTEQLKLEIELDKTIYKPEESIMIKVKIENLAKGAINLAPILTMSLLIYLKYEEEQKVVPLEPLILLRELVRKENIIRLHPDESHVFERQISKTLHYIMPNKVGRYELYVIYDNKMENLEGIELWIGEIKSNVVKFEIK